MCSHLYARKASFQSQLFYLCCFQATAVNTQYRIEHQTAVRSTLNPRFTTTKMYPHFQPRSGYFPSSEATLKEVYLVG